MLRSDKPSWLDTSQTVGLTIPWLKFFLVYFNNRLNVWIEPEFTYTHIKTLIKS